MEISEKAQFIKLLKEKLATYDKPLPEAGILGAWWSSLEPYPLRVVAMALESYCDENGVFAPVAAGIAMRCKLMDGRPGEEEAWATALTSRDEADTVVWTAETAEAFGLCWPILDLGDEVGARMAFKESYARLVVQARSERRPAAWVASLGWDVAKRTVVLRRASVAGLLAAPATAVLLPAPAGDSVPDANARVQLASIRQMLLASMLDKERIQREASQARRKEVEDLKRATNERVQQALRDQVVVARMEHESIEQAGNITTGEAK